MISEAIEPQRWPAVRWWTLIGVVLAAQLGLILWLGKAQPPAAGRMDAVPRLELTPLSATFDKWRWESSPNASNPVSLLSPAQLLALGDPTLLALPHHEGFSGPAWLVFSPQPFHSFEWSEQSRWLELEPGQLGSEFKNFMATNEFDALPALQQQELVFKVPVDEQPELLPVHSRLWLAGGLAGRRLLAVPDLPPWPSADLVTNSVVQLLVAADGTPGSAILLKTSRVAPNEADDYALREARKIRFEAIDVADPSDPSAGLVIGQVIFEWRTVPLPATNAPAETVSPK